ncbi:MAG: hypothetical protein DCF30_15180 [Hyphomicrobiales bacterium]|nr:MAG: hypothetical protein DCF30_15180 [Hyphomicrobiales bacterium]
MALVVMLGRSYIRRVIPDKLRSSADPGFIIGLDSALRWIPGQARDDDVVPRQNNMPHAVAPARISL